MRDFFRSLKFKIIVCILALILGFMVYVAISAGAASAPKTILEIITQPFVSFSTMVSDWVTETIDKFANADRYKQENEQYRQLLSEMYADVLERDKLEEENALFREMLKIAEENTDYQWSAPCKVTARNASDIFAGFTINRGTQDGIELYDPVFTSVGLVGIVTEISPFYSKVTTLLSSDIDIGVVTAESKVLGVIENDIEYAERGLCVMSYVGKGSGIKVGEAVVTSGSAFFPEGILVGTVEEIINDENGLSVHVIIKPLEDVYNVTDVFVITDFNGQGELVE